MGGGLSCHPITGFIAYFRVSTDRQGKSGLGLEAQREAVMDYLDGGRWTLVAEFTELRAASAMTGRNWRRPRGLQKQKAKLVIAKLDRLSRNLAFIATLMDSVWNSSPSIIRTRTS